MRYPQIVNIKIPSKRRILAVLTDRKRWRKIKKNGIKKERLFRRSPDC